MRISQTYSLLALGRAAVTSALPAGSHGHHSRIPPCRFALEWSQKEVLDKTNDFVSDLLYWEGKFHQNNVSYNSDNGMTYDGTQVNWVTGERTEKHTFSAASKESLQVMLYAHAIAGSPDAARFLTPENPAAAAGVAASIMEIKLKTYLKFNETYPGFGGFLPWVTTSTQEISPANGWTNQVPGLDNGQLLWAVYAFIEAAEKTHNPKFHQLAENWQVWLDYAKSAAPKLFYAGQGHVCAVTSIGNQSWAIDDPDQTYSCPGDYYLDDPYEGELLTYFLQFFGGLSEQDKDMLWEFKRAKLVSVDYHIGNVGPITVQKGYWFSSHEAWKVLELPYYDVDIVRRVYKNAERVRTCNSIVTSVPGMFASVNNSTDPGTDTIISYISNAGIPSISNQTVQYLEVITPYSVFPTILFDKAAGLAWWRNMLVPKKMQNPYGSTESTRIDGTLVSALVTWDSKITTVVSILGGVTDLVRQRMKADGIYKEFIQITEREHNRVFKNLKGEHVKLCLPDEIVPDAGLNDFTLCQT